MPIRREKKINPVIIVALLVCVAAVACLYYIGLPAIKELKTKNQELAVAQADNKAAKQYISDIQLAYGKLSAIEAQLELLDIAAPTTPDLPEALIQVNEIVNKNQLGIESLSPGDKSGGTVSIGLTVNGSYAQLKQLLIDLEKNLRPIKIDSVAMASSESEGGGATTGGTYDIKMSYVGTPDAAKSKNGNASASGAGGPEATPTSGASAPTSASPSTAPASSSAAPTSAASSPSSGGGI